MNELHVLAAILTVALNARPDHQKTLTRNKTPHQMVIQDYRQILEILAADPAHKQA